MNRSKLRVTALDAPLLLTAVAVSIDRVGLGRMEADPKPRLFLELAPTGAPHLARIVHVSVETAEFLRDAFAHVLDLNRNQPCANS